MLHQVRWLTSYSAVVAFAMCCASTCIGSVQFTVGPFDLNEEPPFVASRLHDASSSASGILPDGVPDNRAFRTGNTSSSLVGSFYGDVDEARNHVTNIRGTLTGNTKYLLDGFDSGQNLKNYVLKLGQDAGAGKTGKLAFETEGSPPGGQYTGGFIDYVLAVEVSPNVFSELAGTFFFKPQAENSDSPLSPNRGTVSKFTLWGYNYMHDSGAFGGSTANWTQFLTALGYLGNTITRPDIVGDPNLEPPTNQTLGISLYVTSNYVVAEGHMPEPTAFIVWGLLMMVGAGLSGRNR